MGEIRLKMCSSALLAVTVAVLVCSGSVEAQNAVLCRVATTPSVSGLCPSGHTLVTPGGCCPSSQCYTDSCVDQNNANGVNECPGLKSYCNNSQYKTLMQTQCPKTCGFCSSTCSDLVNPSTGRSECSSNQALCNNSLYREMMRTQCPKTCGFC